MFIKYTKSIVTLNSHYIREKWSNNEICQTSKAWEFLEISSRIDSQSIGVFLFQISVKKDQWNNFSESNQMNIILT